MLQKNKHTDWKSNLCDHQPDERVWLKIEKELGFQARLTSQLQDLPLYEPDQRVWESIEAKLPAAARVRTFSMRKRIFAVAASIAVVMILSTMMMLMNKGSLPNESEITFNTLTESDMEQDAMAEIRNYCSLHMPACEQSDYRELIQLYDELKAEESELQQAMDQLGDSPEMIQAMIKIENLKSEAIQDLIILIQS